MALQTPQESEQSDSGGGGGGMRFTQTVLKAEEAKEEAIIFVTGTVMQSFE